MTVPFRLLNGPGNWPDADKYMDNWDFLEALTRQNRIGNGGFESWSAGTSFSNPANGVGLADGWILEKGGTSLPTVDISRDGAVFQSGQYSLRVNITSPGSSNSFLKIKQDIVIPTRYAGLTVFVGAKVRASNANKVRVSVTDGVTTAFSGFHSGDGLFGKLSVSFTMGGAPTALTVRLEIAPSDFIGTVNVDSIFLYIIPSQMRQAARDTLDFFPPDDPQFIPSLTAGIVSGATLVGGSVQVGSVITDPFLMAPTHNLRIVRDVANPNFQIRITADRIGPDINVTGVADITASGLNGRDAGAEAASTWYAIYRIWKADYTGGGFLLSVSFTNPTLPATYTRRRRIGFVFNDSGSNFRDFEILFDQFVWRDNVSAVADRAVNGTTPANVWTTATLPLTTIPTLRTHARLSFILGLANGGGTLNFRPFGATYAGGFDFGIGTAGTFEVNGAGSSGQSEIILDDLRRFQYHVTTATMVVRAVCLGFKVPEFWQ